MKTCRKTSIGGLNGAEEETSTPNIKQISALNNVTNFASTVNIDPMFETRQKSLP